MGKFTYNEVKDAALGMPHGTAQHRLRKMIMFTLMQKCGLDVCFKCGDRIEIISDLSIEHKEPWLRADNPREAFFDIENIAFSHLRCNRPHVQGTPRPTLRVESPAGLAWCGVCEQHLPKELFSLRPSRWNGVEKRCKDCVNRRKREVRRNNVL